MACTLISIVSHQSKGTEQLEEEVRNFFNYCATHLNSGVRFMASNMILALHLKASYISKPEYMSRSAGHFYLSKNKN